MMKSLKYILLFLILSLISIQPAFAHVYECGHHMDISFWNQNEDSCNCSSGMVEYDNGLSREFCCGWLTGQESDFGRTCSATPDSTDNATVTQDLLNSLNPLNTTNSPFADELSTPAGIINRIIFFAFPLAGLILFVMLIWGGFEMITGAASKKSMDAGKQRATAAVIGFALLFVSYWIIWLIETIFNVPILGN
ncbi:MAG: hypothetical protein GF390_02180 [Candidatus Pacebacteria bacterium]|nr:hypothetical protein [Candidatus Paceibacterota bacterium]